MILYKKSLLLGPYEVSLLLLNSIGIFDSVMYSPHPTVYLILHTYLRLNQLLLSFLARFLPAAWHHLGYLGHGLFSNIFFVWCTRFLYNDWTINCLFGLALSLDDMKINLRKICSDRSARRKGKAVG